MKYTYKDFPDNSKVWIYQANRNLTNEEVATIRQTAEFFVEDWFSHGNALKAMIDIKYNRFIIVLVDEQGDRMCGRAIDGSINFIKELEKDYQLSFLDRMNIAWKDGTQIHSLHLNEFKEYIQNNKITPNTVVFNNMITQKSQLEAEWEVAAEKSWHKQLF
jgi:hypothetical protein